MKIKPVESLPKKGHPRPNKNLNNIVGEFMRMNVKHAEIEFDITEYCSTMSAYHALQKYSTYGEYYVKVSIIGDKLYLSRTDMED